MATLRELVATFGIKTDKGSIKKSEAALNKFKNAAKAAVTIFASGMIVNSIRNITNEVAAMGDNIDKTSKRLGVNAQALQELRFAGNLAGVSNESLSMSLRLVQKSALEASQGSKTYVEDFARLGVTVTDANGQLKSAEQLISEMGDGFNALTSDTEKTALAQSLLGRSGSELLPLLAQGTEAIKAQRKEA